jgi:alkylation response protein AidB-like acyl-CoA dehydrogenase
LANVPAGTVDATNDERRRGGVMEFRLDEGQVELQQTIRRFCVDRFPLDAVGTREGTPVDRSDWAELAGLGVLGILLPEDDGGSGLGAVEVAIVFEQLGGHLAPGPVLWSLLAAPMVAGAASGDVRVGGVAAGAVEHGAAIVAHGSEVDVLLVLHDDRVVAHRVSDLPQPTPLDSLDPLTPVGRFTGLGVGEGAGEGPGEVVGDRAAATRSRLVGTVLAAALLSGVGARALDVARDHALERHQFGAPIGSFQAIKHLLADMYVRMVSAQSATYAAAAVLDDPGSDDPVRAASGAKVLAGDGAIANARAAIQVLGGMGFTWDMLPNYLLKRAWAVEHEFGVIQDHELHLGSSLAAAGT